ncbi:MAG: phage tail protein [Actinobacteria bacterium]|nr:phage tail protein [Actinomycetota bacterium]
MALVTQPIPSFINGVSQQPAILRLVTQVEAQENLVSSVVEGLKKRPPSLHVDKLTATDFSADFVHFINRDDAEQYITFFGETGVSVFDMSDGTEKTVTYADYTHTFFNAKSATTTSASKQIFIPSGVSTVTLTSTGIDTSDQIVWQKSATGAFAGEETTVRTDTSDADATVAWTSGEYLRAVYTAGAGAGPVTATVTYKPLDYLQGATRSQFRAVSVADFTFLVNTQVTCALSPETGEDRAPEALIFVKIGVTTTTYAVYINPTVASATYTSTTDSATDAIAADLVTDLVANLAGNFTVTRVTGSSVIHLTRIDGADFDIHVEDSFGSQALILAKDAVQSFTDLPLRGVDGFKVKIVGEADDSDGDEFWVEYDNAGGSGTGAWIETVAPGLQNTFDALTMPHQLTRQSDGSFEFGPATWTDRTVGDADSAPASSFIGNTINSVFFFGNRLGFLSSENAIMSETGEFFNFWPTTVTTLLDTDRIDFAPAYDGISVLKNAVQFQEKLILFGDTAQFVLDPGDFLSPRTVDAPLSTEFATNNVAQPVALGKNVYFAQDSGDFSRLRELYVDTDFAQDDAVDVTAHVPSYVPSNVFRIIGSSSEDMLILLSSSEPNKLYTYKYLWGAGEGGAAAKLQSAWSKWVFDADDIILGAFFIKNMLYLAVSRSDGIYLDKINLQVGLKDVSMDFLIHLDRKTSLTGVYSAVTSTTTWTLPYEDTADFTVVLGPLWTDQVGDTLTITRPTSTTITAVGDWSAHPVFVGRQYSAFVTLSEIFLRARSQTGGVGAAQSGRLQLRTFTVSYASAGNFTVDVTLSDGRGTYTYTFHSLIVGQATIGTMNLPDGQFRAPIRAQSKDATITFNNDSHLPSAWLSGEWEAYFVSRAGR